MYLQELQDVIDAVNLVDQFHNNQATRLLVNTRFQYKDKRSVTEFISRLNTFSPAFASQWSKTLRGLNATNGLGARKYWSDVFKDKVNSQIGSYLEYCYSAQSELDATLNRAINYYTQTNHDLTAEQVAYLRNLQMQQGQGKIAGLSRFLKQNNKKKLSQQAAYNKALNSPQQQAVLQSGQPVTLTPTTITQTNPTILTPSPDYSTLGQPLPVTPKTPVNMEVIQSSEEPTTTRHTNIPTARIRADVERFTNQSRQILRPAAKEAASRISVATIRAQPVRQAGRVAGYFLNQLGVIARNQPSSIRAASQSTRLGISGVRTGTRVLKAAGLLGRNAAMANPWFAAGIAILSFFLLFFFITVFNPNASECPVWSSCPQIAGTTINPVSENEPLEVIKNGDPQVANGVDIHETILVKNIGTGQVNVELIDPLPKNVNLVESSVAADNGKNDSGILRWPAFNLAPGDQKIFKFTLIPTEPDAWVNNAAEANATISAPPVTIGGSCPDTSSNINDVTCKYLDPAISIFDTNISQTAINAYIAKYSPIFINAGRGSLADFTNNVNYAVQKSKEAGINPAIVLGLWKSESAFGSSGRILGCASDATNWKDNVDCALGVGDYQNPVKNPIANCARTYDANSKACQSLKSGRIQHGYEKDHPINYPIATFDDFMEAYGPFNDAPVGRNCSNSYNIVLSMAEELGMCKTTSSSTQ